MRSDGTYGVQFDQSFAVVCSIEIMNFVFITCLLYFRCSALNCCIFAAQQLISVLQQDVPRQELKNWKQRTD